MLQNSLNVDYFWIVHQTKTMLQKSLKNDLSEMSIESQPGCKQQIFSSFLDGQAMDAVVPEVDGDDEEPESCN